MNPVEPLAAPQRQHLRYLLEQGLPLASRPYRVLAERIGAGEDEVLEQVRRWDEDGLFRRFGVILHHRALGYTANAMLVLDVADAEVDAVGRALADEPIASLDPESARKVMDILADINRHDGKTVVVTLHQVDYALRYCPRAVALKGGRILFDGSSEHLSEGFLNELYGAEGDTPLLFSDRARRGAESQPELTLARA